MTGTYEIVSLLTALFLSLCAFSLIFGDNWFFRLASAVATGAMAAYICIFLVRDYLIPFVTDSLTITSGFPFGLIILAAGAISLLLLCTKFFSSHKSGGNLVLALLFMISAAILIAGSAQGSLYGLFSGLISRFKGQNDGNTLSLVESVIVLISAILTLFYSQHYLLRGRRNDAQTPTKKSLFRKVIESVVGIGLGVICAGAFTTSAYILVNHLYDLAGLIMNSGVR